MEQHLRSLELQVDAKEILVEDLRSSNSVMQNVVLQLQEEKNSLNDRLEESSKGAAELKQSLTDKIRQLESLRKQETKDREDREYELKGKMQMLEKENHEQKVASDLRTQHVEKTLEQEHIRLLASLEEKETQKIRERDDKVSHLTAIHESGRASLLRLHDDDIQSLRSEYKEMMDREEKKLREMADRYASLRQRFDGREPRKEDVEKINLLESRLGASEAQLAGAREKLLELRREMLLREDNYNKHFKNGGVAQRVLDVDSAIQASQGVVDWMMSSRKRPLGGSK